MCRLGVQCDGSPYIQKLDITQNHPLCRPGFQCSGMLQDSRNAACLISFVSEAYKVTFEFADTSTTAVTPLQARWAAQMQSVKRWTHLLRASNAIFDLWHETNTIDSVDGTSLRQLVYSNK